MKQRAPTVTVPVQGHSNPKQGDEWLLYGVENACRHFLSGRSVSPCSSPPHGSVNGGKGREAVARSNHADRLKGVGFRPLTDCRKPAKNCRSGHLPGCG